MFVFIGNGRSVSSPVYIDDLINGILLATENGRNGQIYILGGEKPVTKQELINAIADRLGIGHSKIKIPRWFGWLSALGVEYLGRIFHFEPILTRTRVSMMADNFGYSIQKAKKELGYKPQTGLRNGIAKTVTYYLENGLL